MQFRGSWNQTQAEEKKIDFHLNHKFDSPNFFVFLTLCFILLVSGCRPLSSSVLLSANNCLRSGLYKNIATQLYCCLVFLLGLSQDLQVFMLVLLYLLHLSSKAKRQCMHIQKKVCTGAGPKSNLTASK